MLKDIFTIIIILAAIIFSILLMFSISNSPQAEYETVCIDGVEYINHKNYHGLVPHFKPDGSLFVCEKGGL